MIFIPSKGWHRTLGTRMALVLAAMMIVLTMAIVLVIDIVAAGPAKAEYGQSLADLAVQTSEKLDQGMFERYREMMLVARRKVLQTAAASPEERDRLREVVNGLQETYPYYAWIGMTDIQGKVLVATNGMLEGVDVSQRPWWKDAFNGINVGDVHAAKLLEKKLPPSMNYPGDPIRFVDIAFPVRDPQGKVIGILGAHLNWEWAKDVSRSILEPVAKRHGVEMMIVAIDGTVLLGPKHLLGTRIALDQFMVTQDKLAGYIEQQESGDGRYLIGYSATRGYQSYLGLGWTVLVRQPLDEALAPIKAIQMPIAVLGSLVTLAFCLIGVLITREVTQPLVRLAKSARKVTAGEATTLDTIRAGYPELHDLADSFGKMLFTVKVNEISLRTLNQTLEHRVVDRTRELAASQERLQLITDNVPALIALTDVEGRYIFCNQRYEEWVGKPKQEIIGRPGWEVIGREEFDALEPYRTLALSGQEVRFENERTVDNKTSFREVCYIPTRDGEQKVTGFYVLAYDITERKQEQIALRYDVLHDILTGLPNRKALMLEIPHALARCRRNQTACAVLFLDIDRFKQINDTYGHGVGDDVLKGFAARLRQSVRETDTVVRLAGDEFVVLAEGLEDSMAGSREVARKILMAMKEPLECAGVTVQIGTSIGIVIADATSTASAEQLIEQADAGMYAAKQAGRNCFRLGKSVTLTPPQIKEAA